MLCKTCTHYTTAVTIPGDMGTGKHLTFALSIHDTILRYTCVHKVNQHKLTYKCIMYLMILNVHMKNVCIYFSTRTENLAIHDRKKMSNKPTTCLCSLDKARLVIYVKVHNWIYFVQY